MKWGLFVLAVAVGIVGVGCRSTTSTKAAFSTTTRSPPPSTTTRPPPPPSTTTRAAFSTTTQPPKVYPSTTEKTETKRYNGQKQNLRCWSCIWYDDGSLHSKDTNGQLKSKCKKPSKALGTHMETCGKDEVCTLFSPHGKGVYIRSCLKPDKCTNHPNGCSSCSSDLCMLDPLNIKKPRRYH